MDKDTLKDNIRTIGVKTGFVNPKSHWVPIEGKEYDGMHPAIRSREQRPIDRPSRLKNFSIGSSDKDNVVSINVARENRRFKELKGE
jgi:hypothetical protein